MTCRWFLCILLLGQLCFHEPVQSMKTDEFKQLAGVIRKNRPNYNLKTNSQSMGIGFRRLLYSFKDFQAEPLVKSIRDKAKRPPTEVTAMDAIQDVNYCFSVLKYGYAPYQYFGGDTVFEKAKRKILADITTRTHEKALPVSVFLEIIKKNLDFIQDFHFNLGDPRNIYDGCLSKKFYYHTNEHYRFMYDTKGFYLKENGDKAYLATINEESPEKYLKLSLDADGRLIYLIGTLTSDPNSSRIKLRFKSGEEIKSIVLKKLETSRFPDVTYSTKRVNGIPVLINRNLIRNNQNIPFIKHFITDAAKWRGEKFVILDLRSNQGGYGSFAKEWIKAFTGINPQSGVFESKLITNTALKASQNYCEKDGLYIPGTYLKLYQIFSSDRQCKGWERVKSSFPKLISNKSKLIVLIDPYTASAGEHFVTYLRQLKNVYFIGLNTAGYMISGDLGWCELPHSKLVIQAGRYLRLEPDQLNRDGMGYLPDIWVDPKHALEDAVKFIKKYL